MNNKWVIKIKIKKRAWMFRWLSKKLEIDDLALEVEKLKSENKVRKTEQCIKNISNQKS